MQDWAPIRAEALEALIAEQLLACEPRWRECFARCRIPLRTAPILRFGQTESVFLVARMGEVYLYYEDVEEGFNFSSLAEDGSIRTPGFEQWELSHALRQWLSPATSHSRLARSKPQRHDEGGPI
ncbi:hypothetical protein [Oleiagrimonas soli]|uniref:Uncharacterized protein n=1 Tax=Oleiagrimonas soli TaxID=1543381 RepID=A0A841KC67_9GAMM|nr:hypothetical protein [Oleiagrimonas soli]MBB6182746.1 hypothetical protein [Oleiagrimonas soli]